MDQFETSHITALEPPRHVAWASTDRHLLKTEWDSELATATTDTNLTRRARLGRVKALFENTAGGHP